MHKTWLEVLVTAIQRDPREEDAMEMDIEIDGTPDTLDKRQGVRPHAVAHNEGGSC